MEKVTRPNESGDAGSNPAMGQHSDLLAEKTVTNFILSASELIVVVALSEVQW